MDKLPKVTLQKCLWNLELAYGTKLTDAQYAFYEENLQDLDPKKLMQVVKKIIMTHEFFPKIATIRREYQSFGVNMLSEFEVHIIIKQAIREYGLYSAQKAMEKIKASSPELYEILKRLGWRELCMAPEIMIQQKNSKIYDCYRKVKQRDLSQSLDLQISAIKSELIEGSLKLLEDGDKNDIC